jgi:capsule polysaccharide export protein KpsE/RkpR
MIEYLTKIIMDKTSCSTHCAKSVAYFLLGVVVGGLIFYVTTLVASEFVQTSIFKFRSPTVTSTQLNTTTTLQPTSKIDLYGERGSTGD